MRVIDFFLSIYLSFFFKLLPEYIFDNEELVKLRTDRLIQNRNLRVNDLNATMKQVNILFILILDNQ